MPTYYLHGMCTYIHIWRTYPAHVRQHVRYNDALCIATKTPRCPTTTQKDCGMYIMYATIPARKAKTDVKNEKSSREAEETGEIEKV